MNKFKGKLKLGDDTTKPSINFGFDNSDEDETKQNDSKPMQLSKPPQRAGFLKKGLQLTDIDSNNLQEEIKQTNFSQTAKYKDLKLDDQFDQLAKNTEIKSSSRSSKSGKQYQQQQFQNDGSSLGSMKKSRLSSAAPYVLVEGPEPSQDLSYKWVQRNPKVQVIEQGIPIENFTPQFKLRDLDTEYRLLRRLTETKEHLANQEVLDKQANKLNRYSDLKPFKHTRVRLAQRNADIYDSYINANYINSSTSQNDQIFIATQGPLKETIENFWRMIWQEKVQLIVMLTCVKEGGKQKCDQYWPLEIEDKFSFEYSFEVTLISVESVMPNLIKRKIKIQNLERKEEERIVVHLQYMTWPDHGAPDESDNKIIGKILEYMREYHQRSKSNNCENKIVVHCSAGIGRSGTIIAIYNIQQSVESLYYNKENLLQTGQFSQLSLDEQEIVDPRISVFGVVRRLREQRYCMVQVQTQYEFIFDYVNQWILEKGYTKLSPKLATKSTFSQKHFQDAEDDE